MTVFSPSLAVTVTVAVPAFKAVNVALVPSETKLATSSGATVQTTSLNSPSLVAVKASVSPISIAFLSAEISMSLASFDPLKARLPLKLETALV